MGLYKRNGTWWFRRQSYGIRIDRSLQTKNKKTAEERAGKITSDVSEGTYFHRPKNRTVMQLIERYITGREKTKSDNTKERDKTIRKLIEGYFGRFLLSRISTEMVSDYRQKRYDEGKSVATVNRELGFLRNAYNVAIRQYKWCSKNPVSDIKLDRENNLRDRWLTVEQEEILLNKLTNSRYRYIVKLAINTGLRQDEVLSLTHQQVDLSRKVIIVKGKGSKMRTIPLNETAISILAQRMKTRHIKSNLVFPSATGTKIQRQRLIRAFKKAIDDAGIQDFHFHDLRHTFATRLAQAGVDLYRISKLLGHNDIATTQRYAHHCDESLRDSVDVLDRVYDKTTTEAQNARLCQSLTY